jgi:peptide-methionine (R)-S-oxide reductase
MSKKTETTTTYDVAKTEDEWKAELDPQRYQVLRQSATERAFSGELLDEHRDGSFSCAACGTELFESGTKFESGSGWPSFYDAKPGAVELVEDRMLGMVRTEVKCATCGSHLGHLFDDAYGTPTGMRYCMNSLALGFEPATGSAEAEVNA